MKNYLFRILIIMAWMASSCTQEMKIDDEKIYNDLKNNQTKIIFKINDQIFYQDSSIFKGHLTLKTNTFQLNFTDQFGGNTVLHFRQPDWHTKIPVTVPAQLISNYASTLMIGKVINKEENKGVGYLMSDGSVTVKKLSEREIIITVKGNLMKYPNLAENDEKYPITGTIICKSPEISDSDIKLD